MVYNKLGLNLLCKKKYLEKTLKKICFYENFIYFALPISRKNERPIAICNRLLHYISFYWTNKKQYSNNPKLEVYEIPYKSY